MSLHKELSSSRCERDMVTRGRRKIPVYLRRNLRGLPNLFRNLRDAVRMIYANRHDGWDNCVTDFLCSLYGLSRGLAAARAAMYLARSTPRYWGIENPEVESYCSKCQTVKLKVEFTESKHVCDPCMERRRYLDETREERESARRFQYAERSA